MSVVIPHNDLVFINNIYTISNYLILEVRKNGLPEITIVNLVTGTQSDIAFENQERLAAKIENYRKINHNHFVYHRQKNLSQTFELVLYLH